MLDLSLAQIAAALREGQFSCVELAQSYTQRVQKYSAPLNCFITITEEFALEQAKIADEKIRNGDTAVLTGVPMAHKDIFCTDSIRTTCASKMLEHFVPPYDATVVQKLHEAGAVMLGKTNMDEFAMGSSNENSYFGAVKNPWDLRRVPGGSSGGSAAAVAAGLVHWATGTDTGGSVRQPAALCGITGVKPTYGRVSRHGMIAFASSLDQAGVLCRSAEDAAAILDIIMGFDPLDSTSSDRQTPRLSTQITKSIQGLRIGIPREFCDTPINADIRRCIERSLAELENSGAILVDISLPNIGLSVPTYYVVAPAECSSNLARFDGVRFGHRCEDPKDLDDLYRRSRSEGFGAEVKRRILTGTYVLSAGYYDAYYHKAQKTRQLINADFQKAFAHVDVIAGPTSPTIAFELGTQIDDPLAMYLNDIFTIGVSLAGLPAVSIPCGFVDNLPVGLQLIGDHFAEHQILGVAHHYQLSTDWHRCRPMAFTENSELQT